MSWRSRREARYWIRGSVPRQAMLPAPDRRESLPIGKIMDEGLFQPSFFSICNGEREERDPCDCVERPVNGIEKNSSLLPFYTPSSQSPR